MSMESMEDHHHQACAVVERLVASENDTIDNELGGGDTQNRKRIKTQDTQKAEVQMGSQNKQENSTEIKTSVSTSSPSNWIIGGGLKERD